MSRVTSKLACLLSVALVGGSSGLLWACAHVRCDYWQYEGYLSGPYAWEGLQFWSSTAQYIYTNSQFSGPRQQNGMVAARYRADMTGCECQLQEHELGHRCTGAADRPEDGEWNGETHPKYVCVPGG